MRAFLIFILLLPGATSFAQNNLLYSSLFIADSLKQNANAVMRLDEGNIEIRSASSYIFKNHQIITILNNNGAEHLNSAFGIDKFNKLEDVSVKIYDNAGQLVKKYSRKDFKSEAAIDDVNLLTDNRVLYLQAFAPGYPCTIEIESEEHKSSYVELPDWYIGAPDESVERTALTVSVSPDVDIRYAVRNFVLPPVVTTENKNKVYHWEAKNIKAAKKETNSYELSYSWPKIELVPQTFEYDGYKGEFKDWKSFGQWNYNLYEEASPFSDQRKAEILALIKNKNTDQEKIAVLYDYLKASMRYVSIQLGIGGFKPFAVKFVDDKKYGDCKALTNYMRYLLQAAGIKAYPALINAGYNNRPAIPDFPEDIFNHVILCVPLKSDTMWLECTSKDNEPGVLGSFTENKRALLLTENGGVLVNTPQSSSSSNTLNINTLIVLNGDGGAVTKTNLKCRGEFVSFTDALKQRDNDDKKKMLNSFLNFKNSDAFEANNFTNSGYITDFNTNAAYERLFDFNAGSKYFFQPKISKIDEGILNKSTTRTQPYIFRNAYQRTDTSTIELGSFFDVETTLPDINIKGEYVDYSYHTLVNKEAKTVTVITSFNLKHNIVPANKFSEVADTFLKINKAENDKIVLKKL